VPEGMVYVPAGRMLYGSRDDEEVRGFLTHMPMHDVEVSAFLVARNEVTIAEYVAFLDALPESERKARMPLGLAAMSDGRIGWRPRRAIYAPGAKWCNDVQPCVDWVRLPVSGASREDGERFTEWLASTGRLRGARLCTDREWERAARGADDRRLPNGNGDLGPEDACTPATYADSAEHAGPCAAGTHPVSRSPFGVDDMSGSQWEWTGGPADAALPAKGISRGGSWASSGLLLTIANRNVTGHGYRDYNYGLRVCAAPP
jgi:formylglycine-generating enzyme required for sulfatase activity